MAEAAGRPELRMLPGDFDDPRIVALLRAHLAAAMAQSPRESVHALDVSGLRAPDIRLWALWEADELRGVGALRRLSSEHGEIKSMHVAQAARGRGFGSTILRHIVATAQADGFSRLSLETGTTAYFWPAQALYRRHGFADCPPFGDYRTDPNSLFMTLTLR